GERRSLRFEAHVGHRGERDLFDDGVAQGGDDVHAAFFVIVRADDLAGNVHRFELRDIDLLVQVVCVAVAGDGDAARFVDPGDCFDDAVGCRVNHRNVI